MMISKLQAAPGSKCALFSAINTLAARHITDVGPMIHNAQSTWYRKCLFPKAAPRNRAASGDPAGRIVIARRLSKFLLCLFLFPTAFGSSAYAKNLDILIRYLIPAYLAQNFSAVCQANDSAFLSEVTDKRMSVHNFSEHIKMEIIAGLTPVDTQLVLVAAANTAQNAARTEFRKFSPNYPEMPPAETLRNWCEKEAKPFIVSIMSKHFEEHENFLRIIERAKLVASTAPD